jgi:hypothetical protein
MNDDNDQRDLPRSEDYGGPGDYPDRYQTPGESSSGIYGAGTSGTSDISGTSGYSSAPQDSIQGEQFGEFGDTGTGVDLTEQMDETGAGGEHGASDLSAPVQYGGQYSGPGGLSEVH